MPQINRVRVNNIKYNNGTQIYDDFKMNFSCSNSLYDLANGGGKSLLMLLLLQNLIPNCHLDDKQPIEKLFRGKDCSNVIHSLIEWRLDEGDKSGYKYMTTGFCARKGTEASENSETTKDIAAFDYFNYCIFYNVFNEDDINNLSLGDSIEKITYNGLKKQLRALSSENSMVIVSDIYENRKGEYQSFISEHGLYESEWEIIRGINKTEGHVRTYFEQNYRTSRKVVEDLLIEKIIQKAFITKTNKGNDEDEMAKTLLDIKDKILELSRKKNEISKYDRQGKVILDFINKTKILQGIYEEKDTIETSIVSTYRTFKSDINSKYENQNQMEMELNKIKKDVNIIEKNLETIKLQRLQTKSNNTKKQLEDLENKFKSIDLNYCLLKKDIKLKEAKNYFIDFLESKNKHDETNHLMQNIFKANETLIKELNILSYNKKNRDDERLKDLNKKLSEVLDKLEMFENDLEELANSERTIDNKIAIYEDNIDKSKANIKTFSLKVNSLKNQVNIIMLSEIDNEIINSENNKVSIENSIKENNVIADNLKNENNDCTIQKAKDAEKLKYIVYKTKPLEELIKEYDRDKIKLDKLLEIYSEIDGLALSNGLDTKCKEISKIILREENKLEGLQQYFIEVAQDKLLPTTNEVLKVKEYINNHYNEDGILGIEYLRELPLEEKEELLSKIPFLPYSVIVSYNFNKLTQDDRFKDYNFGNYAIPIISLEAVKNKSDFNDNGLMFAIKHKGKFINLEKIKEEKNRLEREISDIKSNLELLISNGETLEKDNSFMKIFIFSYSNKIEQVKKDYAELKEEIISLKVQRISYIKVMDNIVLQLQKIDINNKNIVINIEEAEEYLKLLRELKTSIKELNAEEKLKEKLDQGLKELVAAHNDFKIKLFTVDNEKNAELIVKKDLKESIEFIKGEWEEFYKTYYKDEPYEKLDIADEELQAKYKGTKKALENKNTDIKGKEELLKNYFSSMEKSEKETRSRGYSLNQLYELKDKNEISQILEGELNNLKEALEGFKNQLLILEKEIKTLGSLKDNLEGSVDTLLSNFSDKFGEYIPFEIEISSLNQFEEDNNLKGMKLTKQREEILKSEVDISKAIGVLKDSITDIEVVLRSNNIPKDKTEILLEDKENIKIYYEILEKEYVKVCATEKSSKLSFESGKEKNIKTLKEMGAFELAEEFLRSLSMPTITLKCIELIENLKGINELLYLQKGKIENDIKDMAQIKNNFENQCIQRCRDVKTELDRLPRLSRLNLNGELIEIVSLKLPYVKEEQQKFYMSNYIEETIKKVDIIEDTLEKIKYIKNQLALKRLFSVIVTDMNNISLKLYKREQIAEQSRQLKYEEAVGSTGQSQGIYIQFLISIINYIKNINSFNADNNKLRKIIFIDNPFGSAKDLYIWEPIFEFLKTNNVQLVVPVRGVTPVISGKFDVNYILGQKLIGDKQQTVVMEVRSQISPGEVEFKKILGEQVRIEL